MLDTIDTSALENYNNLREDFRTIDEVKDENGNIIGVPWVWGTTSLFYNADVITDEITSWSALWDPQYAGKVAFENEYDAAIRTAAMYTAKLTLNGWTACTGTEPYSGFAYKQTATLVPDNSGSPTVTADSTFTSGIQFIKTGIIATDEILGEVQDAINDDGLSVTGYGTVTVYVQEKPTAEINARWQITT